MCMAAQCVARLLLLETNVHVSMFLHHLPSREELSKGGEKKVPLSVVIREGSAGNKAGTA